MEKLLTEQVVNLQFQVHVEPKEDLKCFLEIVHTKGQLWEAQYYLLMCILAS